jgi:hypothetical protein
LLDINAFLGEMLGNGAINTINSPGDATAGCANLRDDAAPQIGPNAVPIALMAVPVRHSQKLIELVLRRLPITADAEIESIAG